jgi:hypothetical protein
MNTNPFESMHRLSDDELLARVKQLVRRECEATASLVAHLAELDARRLYLSEGCSSLFVYCTQVLHLSEHAAFNRIEAARAARKFPVILTLLAGGALHLAAVRLLAPHLTAENHAELLEAARHRSKRDVELLVARVSPRPPVPASIRKLPDARPRVAAPETLEGRPCGLALPSMQENHGAEATSRTDVVNGDAEVGTAAPRQPAIVAPLAPERFRIQFTASAETREKLRRAQDLLRHQIPDGDPAAVFDRALEALLRDLEKKKLGATARPGASRAQRPGSRHIPAAVRRAVWARDGERCSFVAEDGRRCSATGFLELDHVHPHADGGPASVQNCRILCKGHNLYEARQYFGRHEQQDVSESHSLPHLEERVAADSG